MPHNSIAKRPRLLYFIGPAFTVMSLSIELLEILSEQYEVICCSGGPIRTHSGFSSVELKHFTRNPSILNDIYLFIEIYRHIRDTSPDVCIYSTPKIAFFCSVASRIGRVKKRVYIHRGAVYQNFKGIKKFVFVEIDRLTITFSTKIIFISKSLCDYVKNTLNIKHLNYDRRYNSSKGVDIFRYVPNSRVNSSKLTGKLILGYLGRYSEEKGIVDIINTSRMLPMHNIHIMGKDEISSDVIRTKLLSCPNILIHPWNDSVVEFLQSINILLFPSRREGFGNVCMEAAACNVPTIAYNIVGVADAVSPFETGILIEPGSDFATEVHKILTEPDLPILKFQPRVFAITHFESQKVLQEIANSISQ